MISIKLNKELDYEMYKDSYNFSTAGADLAALIKIDHPTINLENSRQYIDDFYYKNTAILEQSRDDLIDALRDKEKEFFDALKSLFHLNFDSYSYKGYISILNCNPRFVETKEFQVFYKRNIKAKLRVVFHEMLHFAFFDYCDANFSEQVSKLDKNSGKFWELSEIFNVIVLNTPPFMKITEGEEKLFYPQLSQKLEKAKALWDEVQGDVHKFIQLLLLN